MYIRQYALCCHVAIQWNLVQKVNFIYDDHKVSSAYVNFLDMHTREIHMTGGVSNTISLHRVMMLVVMCLITANMFTWLFGRGVKWWSSVGLQLRQNRIVQGILFSEYRIEITVIAPILRQCAKGPVLLLCAVILTGKVAIYYCCILGRRAWQ